jgi:dienelactone hydrolase
MVVYIEGDGMAWISRDQLSSNPTPVQPIALKLASIDTNANVLYVARPCQYLWPQKMNRCSSRYWSDKRGSEEVISSINQAISIVKQKKNMSSIRLIGYSGGGGIAALIADRRADVSEFVSVSGNLNYKLFTQTHNLSPMNGSIDPITVANQIGSIPQIHYVGADDKIIPKQIALSFSDKVKVINNVSHDNWPDKWAQILKTVNHDLSP